MNDFRSYLQTLLAIHTLPRKARRGPVRIIDHCRHVAGFHRSPGGTVRFGILRVGIRFRRAGKVEAASAGLRDVVRRPESAAFRLEGNRTQYHRSLASSARSIWQSGTDEGRIRTAFYQSSDIRMTNYKRIMLKLSGEALSKEGKGQGINQPALQAVAKEIAEVAGKGIQVVVVVGGGNIWRFRDTQDSGIERTASDTMGMLATIMNGVALQAALESLGMHSRVASAIQVPQVAEPYIRRRCIRHLEKGRVVICAGGTGNPFFTTDSAAALRALELQCDVVL